MPLKVLILGANGFIGSSLTQAILTQKDWEVYGMDIGSHTMHHRDLRTMTDDELHDDLEGSKANPERRRTHFFGSSGFYLTLRIL